MQGQIELLTTHETAALLHRANRTIQSWGLSWERAARAEKNPDLPSAPAIGLRRSGAIAGRSVHDLRDIDEYLENSIRETLGQPLLNWRKEVDDVK
jgi:hypothetical protein